MPDSPGPAYRIETERLVIRCWQPTDAALLVAAVTESVDHLKPWMPWAHAEPQPLDVRIENMRHWRAAFDTDKEYVYGVFDREETRCLGGTGLHERTGPDALEIGYWVHVDYINRGLATELSAALTRVAFEVNGVKRVEIHCDPANVRSAAVPRKLGFIHEATLRGRMIEADGSARDSMVWSMFADGYPESVCAAAELAAYDVVGRRIV